MYEAFYHLNSNPFRLTPDPKFCFSHAGYKSARQYLDYALRLGEGFIMVTGRPGTGKTTLAETFLKDLDTTKVSAKRVAVSGLEANDLLRAVAFAYGIDASGLDKATLRHRIRQHFILQEQRGRRALLIIDEAQGLPSASLEELRLLADLQTGSRPLLQLILVGQEALRDLMCTPGMDQLQQRIIATCHLKPLGLQETRAYIKHRLSQAGWKGDPELTGAALLAIHQWTRGVPRHINKLCNRLLVLGYGNGKHILDEEEVRTISVELREELLMSPGSYHETSDEFSTTRLMGAHGDKTVSLSELALDRNSVAVEKPQRPLAPAPVSRPETHDATQQSRQTAERRIESRARRESQPVKSSASRESSDSVTGKVRQRNAPGLVRKFTWQNRLKVGMAWGGAVVVVAALLMIVLARFYGEEHTERVSLADKQRALTKPSLLAHGGSRENTEIMIPHTGEQGPATRTQSAIPAESVEKPLHRQFGGQPTQSFTTEEAKGDLKHGLISRLESLPPTAAGMENDTTSAAEDNDNAGTTTSSRQFATEDNLSVTTERKSHETISDSGTATSTVPVPDDFVIRVQELAESGDARAQYNLGMMCRTGKGVPENPARAAMWFEKAAAQGNVDAQYNLGMMYDTGDGVPINPVKSMEWFLKAAAQEDAMAQNKVGMKYANGDGVPIDSGKAMVWFQRSATHGYSNAQYNLGMMYATGEGAPRDVAKAAMWFMKAAAQGDADAQFRLGVMYRIGEGVPKNPAKAAMWFMKAAAQGNSDAQFNLGMMHYAAEGTSTD